MRAERPFPYHPEQKAVMSLKQSPLPMPAIVSNLRTVRLLANDDAIREGTAWYPGMKRLIREIADECRHESGDFAMTDEFATGVFVAFSQNSTWKANVTMASNYLSGRGQNGLPGVMSEIACMEDGEDPIDAIGGFKRKAFHQNLMGDLDYVTCDRWHLRAAFPDRKSTPLSEAVYAAVSEATQIVAEEFGEAPATCQAIIWCVLRGTGA